jgi:hypothetical protein
MYTGTCTYVCIYIYMYIRIYEYICICMYIYMTAGESQVGGREGGRERERERERWTGERDRTREVPTTIEEGMKDERERQKKRGREREREVGSQGEGGREPLPGRYFRARHPRVIGGGKERRDDTHAGKEGETKKREGSKQNKEGPLR